MYPYYDASEFIKMSTVPHQDPWVANLWSYPMQWSDFFREANLLGLPERFVYLPQAWTLSVELTLSLWIPFAVMLALWCLWAFIITGCAWMFCFGGSAFIFHFMLGIAFAKYHDRICHSMERDVMLCSVVGVAGFVLYAAGEALLSRGSDLSSGWIPGIGAFMMLAYCAGSPGIQRLLNIRVIRYLGKISYSVYLIHFAILFTITPRFLHWLDATPQHHPYAWWAGLMLPMLVTVLLADLQYRWVETPARRVLRK